MVIKNIKYFILIIFLISQFTVSAQESQSEQGKEEKNKAIYTQADFDKKLAEETERLIKKLKKKSVEQLTTDILAKEAEQVKAQADLITRKEQLKVAEESLSKKIVEFEKRQRQFLGCLDEKAQRKMLRVDRLVKIMANMKPQKAAEVLSVQEADISVNILSRIEPERASKIFNMMDKEVSARLQKQYLLMKQ